MGKTHKTSGEDWGEQTRTEKGGCVGQKELLLDRTVRGFKNHRERVKIGQRQSPGCCGHYTCRNRGLMALSRLWGGVSAQGGSVSSPWM